MNTISRLVATLGLSTALLFSSAGLASAQRWVHADPSGDAVTLIDEEGTPTVAPEQEQGDVVQTTISHTRTKVVIRVRMRAVPRDDWMAFGVVRTPRATFDLMQMKARRQPALRDLEGRRRPRCPLRRQVLAHRPHRPGVHGAAQAASATRGGSAPVSASSPSTASLPGRERGGGSRPTPTTPCAARSVTTSASPPACAAADRHPASRSPVHLWWAGLLSSPCDRPGGRACPETAIPTRGLIACWARPQRGVSRCDRRTGVGTRRRRPPRSPFGRGCRIRDLLTRSVTT
ncbi:hypothetical protein G5V59_01550 [Nocardioides sp. W3-2-3]|uniref:hypothetical protein n=1 Tax=Nocardioides convexus TaxID=2712224 RepID=UPI0024182224|nr:hypothetical protein [Nocardioides convexus]NGZ99530.1 hypothetical protein [Nocardioides convexus]